METFWTIFIAFAMGAILQGIFPTREGWDAILLVLLGGAVIIGLTVWNKKEKSK